MVTELVDGETLRARLDRGVLPPRRAVAYALQIAKGIAAAHARGIVHRDLKPENVMITRDDQVKILDFGLAKSIDIGEPEMTRGPAAAATNAGMVLGTFGYMAPEQVRGLPVDQRADMFAFGAVLYEMLTGERAFRGETAADTMSAILSKEPPDLDTARLAISPSLDRIVRRCLEKSPELRFQSANDLAFALETLSSISTSSATTVSLAEPKLARKVSARLDSLGDRGGCGSRGGSVVAAQGHGGDRRRPMGPIHADQRGGWRRDVAELIAGWQHGGVLDPSERQLGHLFAAGWRPERNAGRQRSAARRGGRRLLTRRIADRVPRVGRCGRHFRGGGDGRVGASRHRPWFRSRVVPGRQTDRVRYRRNRRAIIAPWREHAVHRRIGRRFTSKGRRRRCGAAVVFSVGPADRLLEQHRRSAGYLHGRCGRRQSPGGHQRCRDRLVTGLVA